MREGRPSLTARGAAHLRSQLVRGQTPEGDAEADVRLTQGLAGRVRVPKGMLFHVIAARTKFFDEQVLEAIGAGITQIVAVAAGYDGRALRFKSTGVRFFELDHPSTQTDKRRRLADLGTSTNHISFAAADFTNDDVAAALARAGHDSTVPSLFLCEGILLYLSEAVIRDVFRALRSRAATGSIICADFPLTRPDASGQRTGNTGAAVRVKMFDHVMKTIGEPVLTRLPMAEVLALFRETGWFPEVLVDPSELDTGAGSGHTLMVTASAGQPRKSSGANSTPK